MMDREICWITSLHVLMGCLIFLWVDSDRFENHRRNVYDLNWNLLNCRISGCSNFPSPPKPQKLSDMITIASILSRDFSYVR